MNHEQEQWINKVMNSMHESSRAVPPDDLLERIEQRLTAPTLDVISKRQGLFAAAAAILLLVMNTFVWHNMEVAAYADKLEYEPTTEQVLISNYNIYE